MISFIRYTFGALLLIFAQVLIFNRIETNYAVYLMIYPLFLLLLPFRMPMAQILLLSFVVGFAIDNFMNTFGLHASSLVFVAYLRPFIFKIIAPNEEYIRGNDSGKYTSSRRFLVISFLLLLAHHTWYLTLESFDLDEYLFLFIRIALSTAISTTVTFIIFLLFLAKNNVEK